VVCTTNVGVGFVRCQGNGGVWCGMCAGVEVDHPQVVLQLFCILRGWVLYDYLCVLGGGGGALLVDDVAQHLQLGHNEGALAEVDCEAVGGLHGEELVQVFLQHPAVI
jgi:hypothetical protein